MPEERRAKVLSVHMMAETLSSPIGQLVLGQVMDRVGARETMVGAGIILATTSAWFVATGRLRALDGDRAPQPARS